MEAVVVSHYRLRSADNERVTLVTTPTGDSCPVCQGIEFARLPWSCQRTGQLSLAFELLECSSCSTVRLEHLMTAVELDEYIRGFLHALHADPASRDQGKALKLFGHRAGLFAGLKRGRLLDVGCERGYFLHVMRERGWDVEGVEPFEPFAEYARREFGLSVLPSRLEDLRTQVRYDMITMWHVLEHLEDPVAALRKCSQLLAPGGVLFFEIPNVDSLGVSVAGAIAAHDLLQ